METEWGQFQLDEAALLVGFHTEKAIEDKKEPFSWMFERKEKDSRYAAVPRAWIQKVPIRADGTFD